MLPATENMLPIAQVLKSYGTDGVIVINFAPAMPNDIDQNEPVFLLFEGLPVPFFIESFQPFGTNRAYLKLEDIESLKDAEEIVGQKIFLPEESLDNQVTPDSDDFAIASSFVGYQLFDQNNLSFGTITGLSDFSGNICLELGEKLIPFHRDLLISSNRKKKTLILNIPAGL